MGSLTAGTAVVVALVGALGSTIVAALSYLFTKRQQLTAHWRDAKLAHYRALLQSISDLAVDNADIEAHRRFASAVNTVALVGPQVVVDSVLAFHQGVRRTNPDWSLDLHDALLTRLVLEIRRDLGMRPRDDVKTFRYWLAGAPPRATDRKAR